MNLSPVITSKTNSRVKALRASLSGKASGPGDLLGLEGEHLVAEAARSGLRFEAIYLREGSESILERPALTGIRADAVVILKPDVFASAVDTGSPQGIAALVAIPDLNSKATEGNSGLLLMVETMQDPGNLGTLLRAGEAFGVSRVLITPDTVNPWNPKTVRASAGSVFRVPVEQLTLTDAKAWLKANGIKLVAAVAQSERAIASHDADLSGSCALLVGNEGAGLSPSALALADELVHIPCMTESLNAAVAGSVLMYEAMRQRLSAMVSAPGACR